MAAEKCPNNPSQPVFPGKPFMPFLRNIDWMRQPLRPRHAIAACDLSLINWDLVLIIFTQAGARSGSQLLNP
jgi:hypothetical protein